MTRGGMHGSGMHGLMAPANPTVPPSLTQDPRLIGTAPLPPHHQPTSADVSSLPSAMLKLDPEDAAVDRAIEHLPRLLSAMIPLPADWNDKFASEE